MDILPYPAVIIGALRKLKPLVVEFKKIERNISLKKAPFLRLLFPLISGILIEYFFPVHIGLLILPLCLSCILFVYYTAISFTSFLGTECIAGVIIQIVFFSFGRILTNVHQDKQIQNSVSLDKTRPNLLILQILNDPVQKNNSSKCLASVRWFVKDSVCYHENEKILVYFPQASMALISTGNQIITRKSLQPIENFMSFDFDFKKYCRLKHIYAQVFLKEKDFSVLGNESKKSTISVLEALRKKLVLVIKQFIPVRSEYSLLEALMLGFTADLEPVVLKYYADTGVIHIIAISGLHLALICHILQLALQKTDKKKYWRWIKLFVILFSLWTYSFLSGASPSVIRSAAMVSLILFAKNILRETSLLNTLASSALLLLCFDPYWIFDAGFQLSYAAVLSLGLFSKPLQQLIPLRNKIVKAVWNAASVSIAAQILTTPICIYYFHRFPVYFLPANLVAVPLSSAILIGGIVLCLTSSIQPIAQLAGWILGLLINLLNKSVHYISVLPGAVINISFSFLQILLLYVIIFCFYRFIILKDKSWLLFGLAILCIFRDSYNQIDRVCRESGFR